VSGQTYFAPWRVLKPGIFVAFLLGWNGMFLIAVFHEHGSGVGAFKTPESNLIVVGAFALTLLAVLALLLSTRIQTAALRAGTDIESIRMHLWLIAVVLLALAIGFSAQACSVSTQRSVRASAAAP
jgi:nitrate reductase gamma subunit